MNRFNRRSMLRGMLGGTAVCVGIPALDIFLDGHGKAYADGAKLPLRFGTFFWGLGLTPIVGGGSRWVPGRSQRLAVDPDPAAEVPGRPRRRRSPSSPASRPSWRGNPTRRISAAPLRSSPAARPTGPTSTTARPSTPPSPTRSDQERAFGRSTPRPTAPRNPIRRARRARRRPRRTPLRCSSTRGCSAKVSRTRTPTTSRRIRRSCCANRCCRRWASSDRR